MVRSRLDGKVIALILTAALMTGGVVFLLFRTDSKVNEKNLEFLKAYGWQAEEEPVELCRITIPEEFDSVFSVYHQLGVESGFDLEAYRGKHAMRYTYRLLNHEKSATGIVRVNILIVKDEIVSAHICSIEPEGFIQSVSNMDGQIPY